MASTAINRTALVGATIMALACALAGKSATPDVPAAPLPGRAIYEANCAGCHGRDLQGASATALVKSDWSYGRTRFAISNNIRNGLPSAGMPAWGKLLGEQEQKDLLDYILATQSAHPSPARPLPSIISTKDYRLRGEILVNKGLTIPWGIEFVDPRHALISDRSGQLFWMIDGALDPTPITGLPPVDHTTSTGGLFDIALDPEYPRNGWVYLALAHSENPGDASSPGMTRVIRGRIDGHRWYDTEYLFRAADALQLPNSHGWGGRLLFDKAGDLYFSIGDMSRMHDAQDLSRPNGKLFRITSNGHPARGNPFPSTNSITGALFAYGLRNVQGLAQQPGTGAIWGTDHGPHGGDELDILQPGRNYGWPIATYGVDYDGSVVSETPERKDVERPVRHWTPAPAVSAIDFVTGALFPKWRGNLLMGSLSHETLFRFVVDGSSIIDEEILLRGYGRIRDVKIGPDGAIYLVTNNPATIVRLTPFVPILPSR
ncbi:MAG: PQQ-dependent sugar dehydrogenase [Pseudomonadota bacterium]